MKTWKKTQETIRSVIWKAEREAGHMRWAKRMAAILLAGSLCIGITADYAMAAEETELPDVTEYNTEDKVAKLHNPIVDEEAGTVTFSYVYMGVYPQGEISGEALTDEIVGADYVSGEAVVDGKQYRMEQEDGKKNGKKHYFLYEPIRWRVISLQGDKALLRTDQILDYKYYNTEMITGGRWENTTLQIWLNGYENQNGFLQTAFTEKEADAVVVETEIESNRMTGTGDKIFLLTAAEHYISGNFKGLGNIMLLTTKADYANWKSADLEEKYGEYWTRNPSSSSWEGLIPYINKKGWCCDEWWNTTSNDEHHMLLANQKELGICPAIMLDLTQTDQWGLNPEDIAGRLEEEPIPGDLDGDKTVSLSDAQLALKAALKILTLEETEIAVADIDGDGMVNLEDAQMILKMALKIIS